MMIPSQAEYTYTFTVGLSALYSQEKDDICYGVSHGWSKKWQADLKLPEADMPIPFPGAGNNNLRLNMQALVGLVYNQCILSEFSLQVRPN